MSRRPDISDMADDCPAFAPVVVLGNQVADCRNGCSNVYRVAAGLFDREAAGSYATHHILLTPMHKDPPPTLLEGHVRGIVIHGFVVGLIASVVFFGGWALVSSNQGDGAKFRQPLTEPRR